jgi:4-alpha-glucanotransferase
LDAFALYSAAQLHFGPAWADWPPELQRPDTAEASRWAHDLAADIEFFRWCQWQLDMQFFAVGRHGVAIFTDLPVGTPYSSADCWLWQDFVRPELQLGAPGDYFNPSGHRWSLTPFDPALVAAVDYRPIIAALRNTLRHADGVRIDHAFGLIRQHCLPASGDGPGRWIQQSGGMVDAIGREARQRGACVLSEELGTAPPTGLTRLRQHGFRKQVPYISDQFDDDAPPEFTGLSCHDLPTVAALLSDADDESALDHEFRGRARKRLHELEPAVGTLPIAEGIALLYGGLARRVSADVAISPEDILAERRPVNLPGVPGSEWPSFLRRLPSNAALMEPPALGRIVAAVTSCDTAAR